MQATIQSIHFTADTKLKDYINIRLEKLETYYDRILKADVFLKLENEGAPVKDKIVEIRLYIPGNDLFAKETSKSFEESTDAVVEQLRRQIIKQKEKISAK
jgi:putative sigma-54 modulation protein